MLSLLFSGGSGGGGNGCMGKQADGRTDGWTVGRREMTNWSDQHYRGTDILLYCNTLPHCRQMVSVSPHTESQGPLPVTGLRLAN